MPADAEKGELQEFPVAGPFGGVQSEMPLDMIEDYGFLSLSNIVLRKGTASVRPGAIPTTLMPNPQEPWLGIGNWFADPSNRIQFGITPTRLLKWQSGTQDWAPITGGPLTGPADQLFGWAVVNYKLCFSQGYDNVQLWDGITPGFADAGAGAIPARYLMELNEHLVIADVIEGGGRHSQRIKWSIPGDPTDWTSFGSGESDVLNDLGPITGLAKLYQQGYATHVWGVSQVIPTGNALDPFSFIPLASKARGNAFPYSLAAHGGEYCLYVGEDNVYMFNGTAADSIGDAPLSNSRARVGARTSIFADLITAKTGSVVGYVSDSVNGRPFNAYWLVIPGAAIWMFNLEEMNWTRWTFDKIISDVGGFFREGVPRIMDLIGRILDQNWTPSTLAPTNPFESALIGFVDGTPGVVDFTTYSEKDWTIVSGQQTFHDRRHQKTIKKFRIAIVDNGPTTFVVSVFNELGQSQVQTITLGSGSGLVVSQVIPFSINGIRLRWTVAGAAGQTSSFSEFCPIYDTGGEERTKAGIA
jgi:hypothetical protein